MHSFMCLNSFTVSDVDSSVLVDDSDMKTNLHFGLSKKEGTMQYWIFVSYTTNF